MELGVRTVAAHRVVRIGRAGHFVEQVPGPLFILRRQTLAGGQSGRKTIDDLAQLIHLAQVVRTDLDHLYRAVAIRTVDQAFAVQHPQRLAQRCAAHAQLRRQGDLGKWRAGRQRAVDNALPETIDHFVDQPWRPSEQFHASGWIGGHHSS